MQRNFPIGLLWIPKETWRFIRSLLGLQAVSASNYFTCIHVGIYTYGRSSVFSVGRRGNAAPTPFLPRLCLLVYFSVFYMDMQYKVGYTHGLRLRGNWGDGFPKIWNGDGPCIRPPNILRSTVIGCEAKYELTKKRCQWGIFFSEIEKLKLKFWSRKWESYYVIYIRFKTKWSLKKIDKTFGR